MRIDFIHNTNTNTPAVLEQWVSEVSAEEKCTAKKVSIKLKSLKFPIL